MRYSGESFVGDFGTVVVPAMCFGLVSQCVQPALVANRPDRCVILEPLEMTA